jgi:hypothetical protein
VISNPLKGFRHCLKRIFDVADGAAAQS